MFQRELNKWVIEDFLKATLEQEVYQAKIQTHPKYIFMKPESLSNADVCYEIRYHESKAKYVS